MSIFFVHIYEQNHNNPVNFLVKFKCSKNLFVLISKRYVIKSKQPQKQYAKYND